MSRPRTGPPLRAALSVLLLTGALASAGHQPAVAEPSLATGAWSVPGDLHGGDQIYDGFEDGTVGKVGLFAMVYRLRDAETAAECTEIVESWPKEEIDYLNPDANSLRGRTYLREVDEFTPSGTPREVPPKGSVEVSASEDRTESWQYSYELAPDLTFGGIFSLGTSHGYTYEQSITISKGESSTANNPTNDKIQKYAYGVTRDYYVVQQRPWTGEWLRQGERIYLGDSEESAAHFAMVQTEGCYRTAYFSPASVLKAKGLGLLSERRQRATSAEAPCPVSVNTSGAYLYTRTAGQPSRFRQAAAAPRGTCIALTGLRDGSTGSAYVQTRRVPKVDGKCPVEPQALCDAKLWANVNDLQGRQERFEPPRWSSNQSLVVRSVAFPKQWLGDVKDGRVWVPAFKEGEKPDRWRLAKAGNGTWRISLSECLQSGELEVKYADCAKATPWHLMFSHHQRGDSPGFVFRIRPADGVRDRQCLGWTDNPRPKLPYCQMDNVAQQFLVTEST
ncbi:hypothetical protein PV682_32070 [Streptomyces niveiscabiei]|uniref:hypothetical protein n=1 Tax=Streptomyces niveiscabiei TaxID=164115 RepID=UPI0029B7C821|nr:hypothetical protein [Streptomyces niveiscabiei]MDX3386061.1 hypothetical protein [Streptomyces niveiscabiei]